MSLYKDWEGGTPPRTWPRILAFDVGGATANALEWCAQDPESKCIVFYDEINKATPDMSQVAALALPKMKPEGSNEEYNFIAKVGDYENRIALDDMGKYGIRFSNAVKQNKLLSVQRLNGYLHPNPRRQFPSWHPKAGLFGSPLLFITPGCPHLIEEIPLQKWKADGKGDSVKDELDRTVKHDAVDCALYIVRILPAPMTIVIPKVVLEASTKSLQSALYWADVKKQRERLSSVESRKKYSPSHNGGGNNWKQSLLG